VRALDGAALPPHALRRRHTEIVLMPSARVEVLVPPSARNEILAVASRLRADHRPRKELRTLYDKALALYFTRILDSVDLAIHETGHIVFGAFGEVIQFAGGTLFQLIVPATFVWYFARRRDRHAATVPLWWLAQNLWNISVYVRDARAQELPLVGGGEHDWAYLLGRFGLLAHDQGIGNGVHAAGTIVCLVAVAAGLLFSMRPTVEEG